MAQNAKSLRENLTYIGGREHNEAARGIASYWKKQLDTNPDLKICILTGKKGNVNEGVVKSDDYLLEKVLDSFNDEELQTYGKRLLLDLPDEVLDSADNLKIVLLDDWSISGSQINSVYNYVIDRHKEYAHCLEINLVTAPKKKILNGFNAVGFDTHIIPVKAYFLARETEVDRRRQRTYSGTHITGSHSAVDYDFERVVTGLVTEWNRRHDSSQAITMPAPTNLVRPYRYDGYILEQRNRLHRIQQQLSL